MARLAWKSPNEEGRISGSVLASSSPKAAARAARKRVLSSDLGSATVTRGPCALVGFGRADRLQGIMPQAALRGAWVGKQSERGKPSASRGQAMAAVARRASGGVRRSLERLDRFQQRNRVLALPFAVVRKFGDDQAGNLAALLAYYGFFSQFPVIGDQIGRDVGSIKGSGVALVIGIVGTLWAGLGITQQAQNAMNTVWGMPRSRW